MTLASCAAEGQPPDFKIAVLAQRCAEVRGHGSPTPRPLPGRVLAPSGPARHVLCSTPRSNCVLFHQTHWDGTEREPDTRNSAPATPGQQAQPRAPAPPPSTRPARGNPHPVRASRWKSRVPARPAGWSRGFGDVPSAHSTSRSPHSREPSRPGAAGRLHPREVEAGEGGKRGRLAPPFAFPWGRTLRTAERERRKERKRVGTRAGRRGTVFVAAAAAGAVWPRKPQARSLGQGHASEARVLGWLGTRMEGIHGVLEQDPGAELGFVVWKPQRAGGRGWGRTGASDKGGSS